MKRESRDVGLRDSGFSTPKKVILVTLMALCVTLGVLSFALTIYMGMILWEDRDLISLRDVFLWLGVPLLFTLIFLIPASTIRWYIDRTAAIKRGDDDDPTIAENMGYTTMPPWTSKRRIEFYPLFKEQEDNDYVIVLLEKEPPEVPRNGKVEFETDVTGYIHWCPETGMIKDVSTTHDEGGSNYRRQGIATYLFHEARKMTPHLRFSGDLSEEARAWTRTLRQAEETS